jgi:hypothetical protein
MIMVSKGVGTVKDAPELGGYGLLRTVSAPRKGHLSGAGYKESTRVAEPALAWSEKLSVEVGGAGTVAQAGVVLPPDR